ncbi:unnamed protein product (macronuclear) [Paramecium tetraurelia]|uniref:CAF1B/HIR1 beta-propeller domain-containing protein n=1 Tax=Paramecium tetraurelia TaxID=5888 RepID=A0E3R2_PARTE|nr:uncharacterized protein GSPATT00023102001 [Paramecium tetraurelia]CAK89929.1 unnamed protein product [Paramecium tetraurelia]|eukprot:XP_001457326.1 hypothetical protein (macronuclear) [Paramecium tetraurelia strain d4-2]
MKLVIPNIIWHGEKERIMAIAIHPTQNLLLTGGSDSKIVEKDNVSEDVGVIKMWTILENSTKMVEFAGAINSGHEQTVNCLKFSPSGKNFASGSDDYKIIIWSQQVRQTFGQSEPRLQWWPFAVLTGHCKEIYDLQWSKNGEILVSGGLDKYVIVWNVKKQKQLQTLDGHTSYVQGVTIDPRLKTIVSLSQDRTARVWKLLKAQRKNLNNLQFYPQHVVRKLENAQKADSQLQSNSQDQQQQSQQQQIEEKKQNGIFLGETSLFTFVRRPDWSPDGSFYILPAAEFWVDNKPIMGAYGFLRQSPQVPCFFLPTNTPALVIRFCPKYFTRNPDIQQPLIDLPYKMIFAIGTVDSLLLYSTDSPTPLAIFGNLHYASITDILYINQGSNLIAISSCDGFCSFVQIEEGYFGQEVPIECKNMLYNNDKIEEEDVSKKNEESKKQEIITEQRVEYKETLDGKKKKMIIPKTLSIDQQCQK